MGTAPPSEALVGFDKVTTVTQKPMGGTSWWNEAKSATDFINANYLLLGKVDQHRQLDPLDPTDPTVLYRDDYVWIMATSADGNFKDDQLVAESHTLDPNGTPLESSITYTYYPLNPPVNSYGALQTKQEWDEVGANFRCTEYVYAHRTNDTWLVNRPIRETIKQTVNAGVCSGAKLAETLYRYAGSANPQDTILDSRALLTYVLRWDGTNYVTEKRTYTAQGLPAIITTYDSPSTTTVYATDARNWTTTSYNTLGVPTQIGRGGADVTTENQWFTYDATFPWLVASVKDSNQMVTQYGYDTFGRLDEVAMPGDSLSGNQTITYAYSDGVAPWKIETSYKNAIRGTERNYYDGLGRLVQAQIDDANVHGVAARDIITTIGYDARGLEVCRGVPYYVASTANAFQTTACGSITRTTTTYDALGRVTSVTTPDGAVSEMKYGVATTITVTGHLKFLRVSSYDGNDHLVNRFSDVFGRLVLAREFTGNNTTGSPYTAYADTRYSYDVMGNLTAVGTSAASDTPPGAFLRLATMTYDKLGRKLTMNDPDMGAWTYVYDPASNVTKQSHAVGTVMCFLYDDLNRPTLRMQDYQHNGTCPSAAGAGDVVFGRYTYGSSDINNNIGKPVEVSWGSDTTSNKDTFTYDGEGRLATQTRIVNGQSFLYQVTGYDLLDRPTSITLPGGEVVATAYDKEGANTLTAGGTQLIDNVGYNERGQLVFLGRWGSAPETTLSYHGAVPGNFRLSKIVHGEEGSDALPDFIYGAQDYDAAGNLKGMEVKDNTGVDQVCNFTASECYSFSYDEMNRLTTAGLAGAGAADYGYTYEYDRLGNITKRTGTDLNMTYEYADPAHKQAVTRVYNNGTTYYSYTYGARGGLYSRTADGHTYTYTFDAENRLVKVQKDSQTVADFAYDADGQRVLTIYNKGTMQETKIYTPFLDYEMEDPPTGSNITRTTYRLAGQIVAVRKNDGTNNKLYYPLPDHLGNASIWLEKDSSGVWKAVANSIARYDPYGNYRTTPSTSVNPGISNHGFTGHRHNNTGANDLDLIYMNARYYLPEVGRFISPDSIVPNSSNPQSFNRYSYVRNNPLNFTDPMGHRECGASDDCSDPLPYEPPPLLPLVEFVGDYSNEEKATFYQAAMDLAMAMAAATPEYESPRKLFLAVFGGPITISRQSQSCEQALNRRCYASASAHEIKVYTNAKGHIDGNLIWVLHEMFHSFNANAIPSTGGIGIPYRQLEQSPVLFNGAPISPFAGRARTSDGYRPGENGSDRTPYRQSWDDLTAGEDFADMGANWVANSFAAGDAGSARYNWMDSRMRLWIALAVNHNQ